MPLPNNASDATAVYTFAQIADQLLQDAQGDRAAGYDIAPGASVGVQMSGLAPEGQSVARLAFEAWTTVTGITFDFGASAPLITLDDAFEDAYTSTSYSFSSAYPTIITLSSAKVNVSMAWLATYGTGFNSYSVQTYIHEIGHALGLNHAGDYNTAARYGQDNLFANDSWQVSAMSYFSQRDNTFTNASYTFLATPMVADVLAIRALYGTIPLRTGDTVYGDNSTAGGTYDQMSTLRAAGTLGREMAWIIVDDGGFDTLDLRSSAQNQVVDHRPEQHSNIYGQTGNLAIAPGTTIERIMTGAGKDIIYASGAGHQIFAGAGADTVFGGNGDDEIHGEGAQSNQLLGYGGNDTIHGGAGNDFMGGGAGNDMLFGESGDNTIYGGAGNDTVEGGTGNEVIVGGGTGTNRLLGNGGSDTITAGSGGDLAGGGAGNDFVYGGAGNDTLYGGTGNDLVAGGADNDRVFGEEGNDTLYLGLGNDFAGGGAGNDVIIGGAGNNTIYGGLGNDIVQGGTGRDVIFGGGDGLNRLYGNGGNDVITAGAGNDILAGGAGNDRLFGGDGNNTIYLGTGNDFAGGGAGNDAIFAGAGNNTIYGGAGNDMIVAGTGRDVIVGGPGADVFVFNSAADAGIGAGRDVITDFQAGVDHINLSALNMSFIGNAAFSGTAGELRYFSGYVVGDIDGDGANDFTIQLYGAPALGAGDFIL